MTVPKCGVTRSAFGGDRDYRSVGKVFITGTTDQLERYLSQGLQISWKGIYHRDYPTVGNLGRVNGDRK